jgi:hypothetical protein
MQYRMLGDLREALPNVPFMVRSPASRMEQMAVPEDRACAWQLWMIGR